MYKVLPKLRQLPLESAPEFDVRDEIAEYVYRSYLVYVTGFVLYFLASWIEMMSGNSQINRHMSTLFGLCGKGPIDVELMVRSLEFIFKCINSSSQLVRSVFRQALSVPNDKDYST